MKSLPIPAGVDVRPNDRRWTWAATTPDGARLCGEAADRGAAQRTGAFAAAVMEAVDRIGRRGF